MKLLIAVLLAVFSTSVLAEWTAVSFSDKQTAYADLSTIRKSGDKIKMWELFDYKVVQITKVAGGTGYLSSVSQSEYDCKEGTDRLLSLTWYAKNMRQGDVVFTSGYPHEESEPIPPGTTAETLFRVACGK